MSELILKFNLPDEQVEADIAFSSQKMHSALYEIQNELRAMRKYGEYEEKEQEMVEKISDMFWEKLNDNGVSSLFD